MWQRLAAKAIACKEGSSDDRDAGHSGIRIGDYRGQVLQKHCFYKSSVGSRGLESDYDTAVTVTELEGRNPSPGGWEAVIQSTATPHHPQIDQR